MLSIDQLNKIWYRVYIDKTIDVFTDIDRGIERYGILLGPNRFIELLPKDNHSDYVMYNLSGVNVKYTTRTEAIQEFRFFTHRGLSSKGFSMTEAYFYVPSVDKYFNIRIVDMFDLVVKVIHGSVYTGNGEKVADYNAVKSLEDTCDYIESYIEGHRFSPVIDLVRNGLDIYSITGGSSLSEMMCLVEDIVDSKTDQLTIKVSLKP